MKKKLEAEQNALLSIDNHLSSTPGLSWQGDWGLQIYATFAIEH